jgi:hypothetical protein
MRYRQRHKMRPADLTEAQEALNLPTAAKRVVGYLNAYKRLVVRRKRGDIWKTAEQRKRLAEQSKAEEGEALVHAAMWLLRFLSEDGWQGPINERKQAEKFKKAREAEQTARDIIAVDEFRRDVRIQKAIRTQFSG